MRQLMSLWLALVVAAPAFAQTSEIRDNPRVREALHLLDVWADAQRAYEVIPGFAMTVIHDQDMLWSRGFGFADSEARGIAPAAGYASTVEDLGRFASWQFRVLHHGADEIIGRNTLREMYRVHWLDPDWETKWGLGFATWRSDEKTYVGHGGSCPGYRSSLSINPEGKIAAVFMANASGVDAGSFTSTAHRILGPAIAAAADTASQEEPTDPALAMYTGTYDLSPWWGESEVILWEGKLAVVSLPTDDPLDDMMELEQTGEHVFRRIRDDESLGEEIRFDVGPDGAVLRMWQHSNFWPKVR